jgi:LuxR family maltose regulon positive regulatory protein
LWTKLSKPQVGPELVRRPRLESRLDRGLDRRLVLISAPAGFGKTTLVGQWLEACGRPAAWLSLHEGDGDLAIFLRYLIAAVRTLCTDACPETWSLLRAPQLPPVDHLATSLINELSEVPREFLLILDDYHRVQSQAVHQLVRTLVESAPRSLQLVLITRADPPLALPALRAGRKMLELRADDLRFTPDETQAFFRQSMGLDVDPGSLTTLEEGTEGWIVGLRLAALSLRNAGELTALTKRLVDTDRYVMDYLMAEILARQPRAVQDIMLRSSILERFCAPLLDALLEIDRGAGVEALPSGSQGTLEWMEQANLFLVPLDRERTWYRYHHLFQRLLQHQLRSESSAELVAALHARAGDWFAAQGLIEEALRYTLAAGDGLLAARLVEQHRHALLNREDWRTLVRWLEMLPQELVNRHPALLLAQAWHQQWLWHYATMPALLQAAEEAIARDGAAVAESEKQILSGEIDALQSALWFAHGDGQRCLECARRALEHIPTSLVYVRGFLLQYLGFGYQMTGQAAAGIRLLEEALASSEARDSLFAARVLLGLTVIYHLSGDLRRQEQVSRHLLKLTLENGLALSTSWTRMLYGLLCYQQNRLAEAAAHFAAVTEHRTPANARTSHECLLNLALTYQAQGRAEAARQMADAGLEFALEVRHPIQLVEARSFQARLALLQGDLEAALRWARGVKPEDLPARTLFAEVPRLTLARVLIAQGSPDGVQHARQILDQVLGIARAVHCDRYIIEVLALQALACDAQGEGQAALDLLRQSLDLAQTGGFVRVFVELGPAMARLLRQVAEVESAPGYPGQILASFSPAPPVQRPDLAAWPQIVEPLTDREHEILELLAQRLSDKEIAQALCISPHTVSKHARNLYGKLQVAGRRQAVSQARALGILPPR